MNSSNHIFLVVGMAGTGKTSFCHRLYSTLTKYYFEHDKDTGLNKYIFSLNLDPAVIDPKMPLNTDIRDNFDSDSVMEKYNLGPNGAVNTALNLFLLNIDTLIEDLKNRKFVIIDTPGQIEAFTWSSPGFVLIEALKALENAEIHILYLIDTGYASNQEVFMANMLYAASLSCRYGIAAKCLFNKIDENNKDKVDNLKLWMTDYIAFREGLNNEEMYSPLLGSLALYLEEFYNTLPTYFVSGLSGEGVNDFLEKIGVKLEKET